MIGFSILIISTMYDLAKREGISPNSYTFPVVHLAKRISDAMNLEPIIGDDGSRVWWRILFWGRYVRDGHFEWKIRPELAAALAEQYPELDCLGSEEEEDHKLISELNQFKGIQESEDVQYKGGKMKKPEPVYANGRKAYPRDRKTAANALAHAHFRCEIDNEHVTFTRRSTGKPYTEPHHLVSMAFSDRFNVALDREENIVSLCSHCHNEIHYGKNAEVLIRKLYSERKQYLESIGVSISIEQLLKMYDISE